MRRISNPGREPRTYFQHPYNKSFPFDMPMAHNNSAKGARIVSVTNEIIQHTSEECSVRIVVTLLAINVDYQSISLVGARGLL
jgi:hypothetical protein